MGKGWNISKKEWIKEASEQLKKKITPFISRETIEIKDIHSFVKTKANRKNSKDSYAEQRRNFQKQFIERVKEKNIKDITVNF